MKTQLIVRGLGIALFLALRPTPAHAASFSAELVDTQRGESQTFPFHFQDGSYRFETRDNGQTLIVVFDASSGLLRVISPAEQAYYETSLKEPFSRLASPFAWHTWYAAKAEVSTEGSEAIDGLPCAKQSIALNGQLYHTTWWSDDLGCALKVDVPICARTVEVRHVQRGPQDPALFSVPAGYRLTPLPTDEPRVPAWAAEVAKAPVVNPPFTQTLSAGKIVRFRPQPGRHVRMQASHAAGESALCTAVGFKGGKPTSDVSGNSMTLNPGDTVSMVFTQTPDEADDVVIRCGSGSMKIQATVVTVAGPSGASTDGTPGPGPAANLRVPDTVGIGSRFEVEWTGPANPDDLITVANPGQAPSGYLTSARTRDGNLLAVWAPNEPGLYEVRYVQWTGKQILGTTSLSVIMVSADVTVLAPALAGSWVEVEWAGPAGESDFISIALAKQGPGASVERTLVKQGNPARVRVPGEPGEYEVRYVVGRASKVVGRVPLTVDPVFASVQAPDQAKAGTDIEVTWMGPAYPEDYICIARGDQPPRASVARSAIRPDSDVVKIRAPREAGVYEIRYILGHGFRVLGTQTITIEAAPVQKVSGS